MIASPDEPFGRFPTRRRAFSQSDVSFVQAVANVLASAVEHRRAEDRLSDVTKAERRRMARALHDDEAATRPARLRGFLFENLLHGAARLGGGSLCCVISRSG
jgi:GAF domain-containing protein